jgi:hypothetical protein
MTYATNFNLYWGTTKVLPFAVTNNGVPVNIGSTSFYFMAKESPKETDATAKISKSTGSGIVITNAAGGLLEVTINPADTTALPQLNTDLQWMLRWIDGANSYILDGGVMTVKAVTVQALT